MRLSADPRRTPFWGALLIVVAMIGCFVAYLLGVRGWAIVVVLLAGLALVVIGFAWTLRDWTIRSVQPRTQGRSTTERDDAAASSHISTVTESVDVAVPANVAYNKWTQFESLPQFMHGVDSIKQVDATHTHWITSVGGVHREFDAVTTEQHPGKSIAWASTDGTTTAGQVTFLDIGENKSRVVVQLDWQPSGAVQRAGAVAGLDMHRIKADLRRFKHVVEQR